MSEFLPVRIELVEWGAAYPGARWAGVTVLDGTVVLTRLKKAETLESGRFARMSNEVFPHHVEFMVPLTMGYSPTCDDRGLNDIFDCIADETEGRWSVRLKMAPFKAKVLGLPKQFDLVGLQWPHPIFTFENATDAVKVKLING